MRKQLTALRRRMAETGVDAYLVPTDDFHGSEYVGEYFKCRSYLSGFTGSAGTLVVLADRAGLWTDGRYFLQAARQLEGSGIDLFRMGEPGVPTEEAYLQEHLQPGQCLAFDGRTVTARRYHALEQALEGREVRLQTDLDLAGDVWPDRPPLSAAPAWELSETYCGLSRAEKLAAVRRDLNAQGADTLLLSSLDDIAWLLNIRGGDVACCPVVLSYLAVEPSSAVLFANEAVFPADLKNALAADGVTLAPYDAVYAHAAALKAGSTVWLDEDKTNCALWNAANAAGRKIIAAPNPTALPKAVKNETEVANARIAHLHDGIAMVQFLFWLKQNAGHQPITERSAAAHLETLRARQPHYLGPSFDPIIAYGPHGAIVHYSATEDQPITERSAAAHLETLRARQPHYLGPSFDPIIAYGPHGAIVHYSATEETDVPLQAEGFLLCDTGGHYLEGTTDITRTVALGPVSDEMKHHYTLVLRSHLALLYARFLQGCRGSALDMIARQPLWLEGLDYKHGTGHGVGYLLSVHEGPNNFRYASAGKDAVLEPGMILSDEPGLYLAGRYGIRLENLLVCRELETSEYGRFFGFDALTLVPFDRDAIDPAQLSPCERAWLNTYHAAVYESLAPHLEAAERSWLAEATAEL